MRIEFYEGRPHSEEQSVEHVDCRFRSDCANALSLRKIVDKESSAAGFCQRSSNWLDSAAIGVAFDHGRTVSIGTLCKSLPIGRNRSQIDFQDSASFTFRRPVQCHARRKSIVVDDETASLINYFSVNRTFDDNVGTRLNRQTANKVATNMQ